jgi:ABC-type sugar transport system, periplasmic component
MINYKYKKRYIFLDKKMKGLTVVLSVLLVLGVFQGLTRVKAEQKIEIRFSGGGQSTELNSYQKMFEEFEKEHPQYKVIYEPILEQYIPKIAMMLQSGTAPDVFYAGPEGITWAKYGYLLPLNEYLKKEDREDFVPALLDALTYKNRIYSVPKDFSVLGMFYNKEMFKKANIEKPPETWDELLVCAQKLKEELGIVPLSLSRDLARWLAFIYQTGAEIVTPGHKESLFTDPKVVESLEFYTQFEKWV